LSLIRWMQGIHTSTTSLNIQEKSLKTGVIVIITLSLYYQPLLEYLKHWTGWQGYWT